MRVIFCPMHRPVWIEPGQEDFRCVCWGKLASAPPRSHKDTLRAWPGAVPREREEACIPISTIVEVRPGKCTDVLQRSAVAVKDDFCLAVVTTVRTLDMQCATREDRDLLLHAFNVLLFTA